MTYKMPEPKIIMSRHVPYEVYAKVMAKLGDCEEATLLRECESEHDPFSVYFGRFAIRVQYGIKEGKIKTVEDIQPFLEQLHKDLGGKDLKRLILIETMKCVGVQLGWMNSPIWCECFNGMFQINDCTDPENPKTVEIQL